MARSSSGKITYSTYSDHSPSGRGRRPFYPLKISVEFPLRAFVPVDLRSHSGYARCPSNLPTLLRIRRLSLFALGGLDVNHFARGSRHLGDPRRTSAGRDHDAILPLERGMETGDLLRRCPRGALFCEPEPERLRRHGSLFGVDVAARYSPLAQIAFALMAPGKRTVAYRYVGLRSAGSLSSFLLRRAPCASNSYLWTSSKLSWRRKRAPAIETC